MKHCRWFLVAAATLLICTGSQAGFQNGLIGYWPFNGNGNDASGNGRDLSLIGNPGFAPGIFGQALDLHANGSQYAQRPIDDSAFNFGSSDFTIQIWVNFHSVSDTREQTLFEKFSGATGPGWTISKVDRAGGNGWEFFAQPSILIDAAPETILPNVWYDLIVRRSGNTFDLFVNDQNLGLATSSAALPSSTNPLLIGRRDSADPRDLSVDGLLDEAAIWNRALTDSEIATLWNGGQGTPVISPSAAAPEPASLTLLVIGSAVLSGCALRRKRAGAIPA